MKLYCLLGHNYISVKSITKNMEVMVTDVRAVVSSRKEERNCDQENTYGGFLGVLAIFYFLI